MTGAVQRDAGGSGDWADLLGRLRSEIVRLLTAADELIRRTDPEVVRVVWPHQRTVGYGVGPKKMSEHYASWSPNVQVKDSLPPPMAP